MPTLPAKRRLLALNPALKGHGFSHAKRAQKRNAALAAEGMRLVHASPPGLRPRTSIGRLSAWLKPCPFKAAFFKTVIFKTAILSATFFAFALTAIHAPAQIVPRATAHPASSTTPTLYRIAGAIVNSATGEPLRHATVAALSEEDSHTIAAVESDSEGHFALVNLPAAKYQLTASKRGYRTAFYDEHQEFNSAIVTGPDQDTGNLTFRLVPGSTLRGVVTTEGGDPVENARVMLFLKSHDGKPGGHIAQSETVNSDDIGAYEFSNLNAGEYLLAVVAEPWYAMHRDRRLLNHDAASSAAAVEPPTSLDVAYPITYFDSTTDEAAATPIVLSKGNHAEADITLHAVPALRIQVDTPRKQDGSIARAELRQTIFGTVVSAESAGFLDAMQTGTTEFGGVAPGHYELAQGDPPRIVEMDATSNLQVDPALGTPTTSVRGTLSTLAGTPLADDCILVLEPVDGAQRQSEIQSICMRGAFTVPSVPAGQWRISAASISKQWSVASITVGAHMQLGNVITVKDQPLSMVVTVTEGSARVQGFGRRDGKGVAGVMVVLVPSDLKALQALARRDQSDSDGSFSLRNVIPGKYTLVAIEDGWELDWAQPEVIARYLPGGIPVTVSDNSGKLVTLAAPVPVQTR
jgi:hypothetical protein